MFSSWLVLEMNTELSLSKLSLPSGLGVADFLAVSRQFQASIIRLGVMQGEGHLAAEDVLVNPVETTAEQRAELMDGRTEVAAT